VVSRKEAVDLIVKAHWSIDDPLQDLQNAVHQIYDTQGTCSTCAHRQSGWFCKSLRIEITGDFHCKNYEKGTMIKKKYRVWRSDLREYCYADSNEEVCETIGTGPPNALFEVRLLDTP